MNHVNSLADFPASSAVIKSGMDRGLHTGCQIYVSWKGDVLADASLGESHPGTAMTVDTINPWLSAGKPVTTVALLKLWEQCSLRLDDTVAAFIPEFVTGDKGKITLRHLLTHTGGFRNVETGWPDVVWEESIRRICHAPLEEDWIVGSTAGYHTTTSWFILGEIIRRVTGQAYPDVIRKEVFLPLGLQDSWASIPSQRHQQYGHRIGQMFARENGERKFLDWHNPARCEAASPGSNARGPIRDLGKVYEMLLNEGTAHDRRIVLPQTVAAMTARQRVGDFDQTLGHVVDFGLGVIVDSNRYGVETVPYGYGRYCSTRTFGHGGAQSSQGWCDPENALVVAYFFNGRAGEGQHHRRAKSLNEAIYLDLGLAHCS